MADEGRHEAPLLNVLGSLHSLLLSGPGVEDLLAEQARVAAKVVEPPSSCGVTTRYDGQPRTLVASDPRAALIDERQYALGEGPCLESLEKGVAVSVTDQSRETRWGRYGDAALELGVKSSLSLPLTVDAQTIAAMNLYGYDRPGQFTEADRERAAAFADQAATTLAFAVRAVRQSQLSEQLEHALTSRSIIDQALGLLMGQQKCDAKTAFELLRRHSQNNNRKLRDVAADLIARHTGQPPVDSRTFESGHADGSLSNGSAPT
ncbi:GAF and ANTAR domain-containing protein [Kribbella sp. NPDC006257]|uniref:GAF and ANTAR domain-containing protein n=1 Tax=Kribbella sp. NPDC006257 TaxID=3156738 RepID=UPI0033A6F740